MRPPSEVILPGPGQESVWDYPRPPRVEPARSRIRVEVTGIVIADTVGAVRVLETAGAPCYYLPASDVRTDLLRPAPGETHCEWKGAASYFDIVTGGRIASRAAWTYRAPLPGYESLAGRLAFYAGRVDAAWVGDERAAPQPGGFYGGWITSDVVGPFKGEAGSEGW
jgi:uncharacterized protein (DUF427 family)